MKINRELFASVAFVAVALAAPVNAQQAAPVSIGNTDIGGVVTGPAARRPACG